MTIEMHPIGHVHNERVTPVDDDWDRVDSVIQLDLAILGDDAATGAKVVVAGTIATGDTVVKLP